MYPPYADANGQGAGVLQSSAYGHQCVSRRSAIVRYEQTSPGTSHAARCPTHSEARHSPLPEGGATLDLRAASGGRVSSDIDDALSKPLPEVAHHYLHPR